MKLITTYGFDLKIRAVNVFGKVAALVFLSGVGLCLQSCDKDREPEPVVCSCEGKGKEAFKDVKAIVVSTTEGFFLLSPFAGYFKPCQSLESNLEIDGLMVRIDGVNKATCDKPDDVFKYEKQNYSIVESVRIATDSLFNVPPFQIQIIRSEDYGLSKGFGYKITHESGFKILQRHLPAVGENKPFLTPTDAFKTAVLVAYKMNLENGLPFLTVQDLRFLQVLY